MSSLGYPYPTCDVICCDYVDFYGCIERSRRVPARCKSFSRARHCHLVHHSLINSNFRFNVFQLCEHFISCSYVSVKLLISHGDGKCSFFLI